MEAGTAEVLEDTGEVATAMEVVTEVEMAGMVVDTGVEMAGEVETRRER